MQMIRVGDIEFQPALFQLACRNRQTHLEPKVSRLLEFFIAHRGEVVSHEQLVDFVWDGRVITDDAIRGCLSKLRKALQTIDARAEIQTVPKGGYRACFEHISFKENTTQSPEIVGDPSPTDAPDIERVNITSECTLQLTGHQLAFIASLVDTGKYFDACDVVREALRLLEQKTGAEQAQLNAFKLALGRVEPSGD